MKVVNLPVFNEIQDIIQKAREIILFLTPAATRGREERDVDRENCLQRVKYSERCSSMLKLVLVMPFLDRSYEV